MKVYFASDHAGYYLKEKVIKYVYDSGYDVYDFGASKYDELDDYPDYMHKVGAQISIDVDSDDFRERENKAIIFGGSGQGEAIVVNRYEGVRAIVYYGQLFDIIKLGREHNNANVLSIGARFVEEDEAMRAVEEFLNLPFSRDIRHERRIRKIDSDPEL